VCTHHSSRESFAHARTLQLPFIVKLPNTTAEEVFISSCLAVKATKVPIQNPINICYRRQSLHPSFDNPNVEIFRSASHGVGSPKDKLDESLHRSE
jgi:hypothetical protein